jgi:hypothetical protein
LRLIIAACAVLPALLPRFQTHLKRLFEQMHHQKKSRLSPGYCIS